MYVVTIHNVDGDAIDTRMFNIGHWQEIGYWLDNFGYIDADYRIEVRIEEHLS